VAAPGLAELFRGAAAVLVTLFLVKIVEFLIETWCD